MIIVCSLNDLTSVCESVKPKYVISLRSNIDLMPSFSKFSPPTDKYSIFELIVFNSLMTFDASLSPDTSPVRIKIFFTFAVSK